jgi:hypothetical protein
LQRVSANVVREWARAALVPKALSRLYEIGMGITQFKVPTEAGNVVEVPASASVQRAALRDVIAVGVPSQVGIAPEAVDLPGVLALGELELDDARAEAHAGVRSLPASVSTGGIEVPAPEPVPAYEPPPEHRVVEVIESATLGESPADTTPAIIDERRALAKAILAKRRRAKRS